MPKQTKKWTVIHINTEPKQNAITSAQLKQAKYYKK